MCTFVYLYTVYGTSSGAMASIFLYTKHLPETKHDALQEGAAREHGMKFIEIPRSSKAHLQKSGVASSQL